MRAGQAATKTVQLMPDRFGSGLHPFIFPFIRLAGHMSYAIYTTDRTIMTSRYPMGHLFVEFC